MKNSADTQITNCETIENNKLIAEFMGLSEIVKTNGIVFKDNNTDEIHLIKYHSEWNWLMPVIQEIGNRTGYELCMHLEYSYWNNLGNDATGSEYGGYENIASIHYAVVSFIKWYNENK